ncbi:hypothetical protein B7453_29300 [Pseudomonas sp. IB20]|nr:hypothetical protein B7453_29300 [Pseudomonas sp. IB20]
MANNGHSYIESDFVYSNVTRYARCLGNQRQFALLAPVLLRYVRKLLRLSGPWLAGYEADEFEIGQG